MGSKNYYIKGGIDMTRISFSSPNNNITDFTQFVESIFYDYAFADFGRIASEYPVSNIYVNENSDLKLEFAITGFKEEEIKVQVQDGLLIISGDKKPSEDGWKLIEGRLKKKSFERKIRISNKLNIDSIEAKVEDGMLEIIIRAKEDSKPKTIPITFNK